MYSCKKRLAAVLAALALAAALQPAALAVRGFDRARVANGADIYEQRDELEGIYNYYISSLLAAGPFQAGEGQQVELLPVVGVNDAGACYMLVFHCITPTWYDLDQIVIKTATRRYFFSNTKIDYGFTDNDDIRETCCITLDKESVRLLRDIAAHRDAPVQLRVKGAYANIEFTLSQAVKDSMIHLYNLFTAAGGTIGIDDATPVRAYDILD